MKRLVFIALIGALSWSGTVAGATAIGEGWFFMLHEREQAREEAQAQAEASARELRELDQFLGSALTEADTATRATARVRRELSEQIVGWEMAERRVERTSIAGGSAHQGRIMKRALAMSRPEASKAWRGQVEVLEHVRVGQAVARELLMRRGELTVVYAQYRAQEEAARRAEEEVGREARGRADEGAIRQELERTARDLRVEVEGAAKNRTREDFHRRKGALVPPVQGAPEFAFGPRAQENSASFIRHTGLTYRVEVGRQVRSVGDGLVIFAGRMAGYGRLLILDHGGGYHSLYAHLDEMAVAVGDQVRNRSVLGETGSSGSLEGPKFYFELRKDGVPFDPEPWFVSF